MDALPSIIIPSQAIKSPALAIIISPTLSSEAFFKTSFPFSSTNAVLGAKSIKCSIAFVVFFLLKPSKYFPKETRVKIITAASKYKYI